MFGQMTLGQLTFGQIPIGQMSLLSFVGHLTFGPNDIGQMTLSQPEKANWKCRLPWWFFQEFLRQ